MPNVGFPILQVMLLYRLHCCGDISQRLVQLAMTYHHALVICMTDRMQVLLRLTAKDGGLNERRNTEVLCLPHETSSERG
jgi:hypothetical protein